MTRQMNPMKHSQGGVVLVVSLLMLLVLTLVGVTAMQLSTRQEKMSGNTRDLDVALQAAEAALRFGESQLVAATLPDSASLASLPGWYHYPFESSRAPALRSPQHWAAASTLSFPIDPDYWDVAQTPKLVIEELDTVFDLDGSIDLSGEPNEIRAFRVSSRAFGGVASTNVILQSTFLRP